MEYAIGFSRSDNMNVIQFCFFCFFGYCNVSVLEFLLNRNLYSVLFCATYRANMDDSISTNNNLLMEWQFRIAEKVDVKTIFLEDLTISESEDFLSKCLRREPEDLEDRCMEIYSFLFKPWIVCKTDHF